MKKLRLSVIKVVMLMALMSVSSTVFACSCPGIPTEELIAEADLIFKGKAIAVERFPSSQKNTGGIRSKFKVITSYKGDILKEVDITAEEPCEVRFTVGEEIIVAALGNLKEGFFTSSCFMFFDKQGLPAALENYRNKPKNIYQDTLQNNESIFTKILRILGKTNN